MEEKALTAKKSGFSMLPLCFIVFASGAALFVYAIGHLERGENALGGFLLVVAILGYIAGIIALPGFKVLKPQEALVLTLFGHYAGTLRLQVQAPKEVLHCGWNLPEQHLYRHRNRRSAQPVRQLLQRLLQRFRHLPLKQVLRKFLPLC